MSKHTKKPNSGSISNSAPARTESAKTVAPQAAAPLAVRVSATPAPVKAAPMPAAGAVMPVKTAPTPAPAPAAPAPVQKPKPAHVLLELLKPEAKQVCVAGSFNEWKPERTPLVRMGNGRWVGDLAVKPGKHEYLFVVDGQWLPDPNAKESVQNPFGGRNSVLTVSA